MTCCSGSVHSGYVQCNYQKVYSQLPEKYLRYDVSTGKSSTPTLAPPPLPKTVVIDRNLAFNCSSPEH